MSHLRHIVIALILEGLLFDAEARGPHPIGCFSVSLLGFAGIRNHLRDIHRQVKYWVLLKGLDCDLKVSGL